MRSIGVHSYNCNRTGLFHFAMAHCAAPKIRTRVPFRRIAYRAVRTACSAPGFGGDSQPQLARPPYTIFESSLLPIGAHAAVRSNMDPPDEIRRSPPEVLLEWLLHGRYLIGQSAGLTIRRDRA